MADNIAYTTNIKNNKAEAIE